MSEAQSNPSPPESLICPLTQEIFKDPVVDPEGNSYERSAIEEWLKKNGTSPITRSPLSQRDLVPNRALREIIESYHGAPKDPSVASAKDEIDPTKEPSIKLEVVSTINENENSDEVDVLISIKAPQILTRTPTDICCVVDVSGSMGSEATLKDDQGKKEANGLSLLDIVKHALKTIIAVMEPEDRLALVSYSSQATKVFGLTAIKTAAERKAIEKKIDELDANGNTNIWDGLQMGLTLLDEDKTSQRMKSLLLLTDGQPNVSPPRGELQMLKRYKDQHKLPGSIHTFGFGYEINSSLLIDLAIEGEGMYCFIPDSTFVGTAFVNSSSNVLSTISDNVTLTVETCNGSSITRVYGSHLQQEATWGRTLFLGTMQAGQSKDIVLRVKPGSEISENPKFLSVGLKYRTADSQVPKEVLTEISLEKSERSKELQLNKFRLLLVDKIREAQELMSTNKKETAGKLIENLIEMIRASPEFKDPRGDGIAVDLKGQVLEALGKQEYYQKWGRHYLPSLMRSHLLQQCNNFKDPGIQFYGGQLFGKLRDRADEIFVKLPPPKPSIPQFNAKGHVVQAQRVDMRSYYNARGGCIHGDCSVKMSDGSVKLVKDVKKGDLVSTGKGFAQVLCVTKNVCLDGIADLMEMPSGLKITPWHPIRCDGAWVFPAEVGTSRMMECDVVYNFVLESGHVMIVDGIECVTLGHGFQADVVKHEYFGSQKVIDDLKSLPGWDTGLVVLNAGSTKRDEVTNLAIGLIPHVHEIVSY